MLSVTAGSVLLLYAAVLSAAFLAQRTMIYFPSKSSPELSAYGAESYMRVVSVITADGLGLHGWYAPPKDPELPVIVVYHGNAAEHGIRFFSMKPYLDAGYGLLLAGYRGYGGNPGKPSETGFYADARAWLGNLLESGIDPGRIVLYGESIGTGVAVQMAAEHKNLRALVLQSPYTSLTDLAKTRYFFLPVDLLMLDRFRNIDKIAHLEMPLLVIAGARDGIVPLSQSKAIFETAPGPKHLHIFENHGHNDMPVEQRAAIVREFLAEASSG